MEGSPADLNRQLMEVVQTDELHRTLALLMSGADVRSVDPCQDTARSTPYLMAVASGQKAQAQLLLLNDADPVIPDTEPSLGMVRNRVSNFKKRSLTIAFLQ